MNISDQIKSFFFLVLLLGTSLSVSIITRIRLRDNGKTDSGIFSSIIQRLFSICVHARLRHCTLASSRNGKMECMFFIRLLISLYILRFPHDFYGIFSPRLTSFPIENQNLPQLYFNFYLISTKTKTPLEYSEQSNSYGINKG